MPLGMKVGLGPDDFVLNGDSAPPPQKGGRAPSPIFGPRLLWPNGWMDQIDTWHGGGPRSRPHCVRWGPSSPSPKGTQPHNFRPMSIVAKRLDELRRHLVWGRPWPRRLCVPWGPTSPTEKCTASIQVLAHVYCGQTAGWIKMPLGTEVNLGPGDAV